jgi:putative endonuclease
MVFSKSYYVYIMASVSGTLYVGFTNDIKQRVWQHKHKQVEGFTKKHNVTRLLYVEVFAEVHTAIGREKQIKGFRREKKVALIDSLNPAWADLSQEW